MVYQQKFLQRKNEDSSFSVRSHMWIRDKRSFIQCNVHVFVCHLNMVLRLSIISQSLCSYSVVIWSVTWNRSWLITTFLYTYHYVCSIEESFLKVLFCNSECLKNLEEVFLHCWLGIIDDCIECAIKITVLQGLILLLWVWLYTVVIFIL